MKFIGEELKQCFTKIDDENKEYIIGGKIGCPISEFLNKKIKINLLNDYNIVKACIEFYEFYEELISEFNDKESNVKILNCDEKLLKNLKNDWESLLLVRNYVNKNKQKQLPIVDNNNNVNDINNENINAINNNVESSI